MASVRVARADEERRPPCDFKIKEDPVHFIADLVVREWRCDELAVYEAMRSPVWIMPYTALEIRKLALARPCAEALR